MKITGKIYIDATGDVMKVSGNLVATTPQKTEEGLEEGSTPQLPDQQSFEEQSLHAHELAHSFERQRR